MTKNLFALDKIFGEVPREGQYVIRETDGEVPRGVVGRYYMNGPARFGRGGIRYRHWLDGDGMVCSLKFDGKGAVSFCNRFVESWKFVEEEKVGRALYRTFGTTFTEDKLVRGVSLASPVNVSVYSVGGHLLAFGEQGLPWELDCDTLETRGEFSFGGRLNTLSPFAAHPIVEGEGSLVNFGVSFAKDQPTMNVYFIEGGEIKKRHRSGLDAPRSVHDFSVSRSTVLFYLSPLIMNMSRLGRERRSVMESLTWEPERGTYLLGLCRETGEVRGRVEIGSGYCLHLINAFDSGEDVVVDIIELEAPVYDQYWIGGLFKDVRGAQPVRYVVNLERGKVQERLEFDYRNMCDFPGIHSEVVTREYEDFWMLGISESKRSGPKFFDQLVHGNWGRGEPVAIYQGSEGCYLAAEPVFVKQEGRGGWILVPELDAGTGRTRFLILDAFDVARGPVARLHLRYPIHLGFHACFLPGGEDGGQA